MNSDFVDLTRYDANMEKSRAEHQNRDKGNREIYVRFSRSNVILDVIVKAFIGHYPTRVGLRYHSKNKVKPHPTTLSLWSLTVTNL